MKHQGAKIHQEVVKHTVKKAGQSQKFQEEPIAVFLSLYWERWKRGFFLIIFPVQVIKMMFKCNYAAALVNPQI